MPSTNLPVDIDGSYPDDPADPSRKLHQQHHDAVHALTNAGVASSAELADRVTKWKPITAYAAGDQVLNPSGQIVSANVAFTSGATYTASNWTDALNATYVPINGNTTINGNKLFSGPRPWIDIEPGPTGGAGTDDALTVMAAIAALPVSGGRIRMTAPAYRFKTDVVWSGKCVQIEGTGRGFQPGQGTTLNCDPGVSGFIVQNGVLGRGAGSIIRGFKIKNTESRVAVTNKALTANVATLTTAAAHGFVVGRLVAVVGVDATFNGYHTIGSTPTATTFTFAKVAANVASAAAAGAAKMTLAITNKALTANVATLTTDTAHGFVVGHLVEVAGLAAPFDGYRYVTSIPTATTFTFAKVAANVASAAAAGQAAVYNNGVRMQANGMTTEDCVIEGFGGAGLFVFSGNVDEDAVVSTNANNCLITHVASYNNEDGFHAMGTDANQCTFDGVPDASGNARYGVNDESFLGNTYIAPHFAGNLTAMARVRYVCNHFYGVYRETDTLPAVIFDAGSSSNYFFFKVLELGPLTEPEIFLGDTSSNGIMWPGGGLRFEQLAVGKTSTAGVVLSDLLLQLLAGSRVQFQNALATANWDVQVIADGRLVWSSPQAVALFMQNPIEVIGGITSYSGNVDIATAGTGLKVQGTSVVGARGAAVADPSGGATVDTEARAALNALLARLRTHGLIAT